MLIVGLGNPGKKYELTRHNIGFRIVDRFVEVINKRHNLALNWESDRKSNSLKLDVKLNFASFTVIKPQTFMNLSGESVLQILKWSKINDLNEFLNGLLVIYDDLDFDAGVIKLKRGGSAGGHNGLQDIITKLGNSEFCRLRVGIGHPRRLNSIDLASNYQSYDKREWDVKDWVLSKPLEDEVSVYDSVIDFSVEVIFKYIETLNLNIEDRDRFIKDFISKRRG